VAMFVNGSGQNEHLYRGPSIDASYQVLIQLAKGFQRGRLKCEKLTDDRRRKPSDGKSSHCLWQGELKMHSILNTCSNPVLIVPIFGANGLAQRLLLYTIIKSFVVNIWITE
jgi:hypothetical protein